MVITKLSNSEQSSKGKVKTHKYINRQNQSTTGKLKIVMTYGYIHINDFSETYIPSVLYGYIHINDFYETYIPSVLYGYIHINDFSETYIPSVLLSQQPEN
jgi:C-terminal processing protease CtpA/Prc